MERAMSVEERIRRAENIYNRRNGVQYSRPITSREKVHGSKKRTVKKLLMQIFVCLAIYIIFYAVSNRDYVFSEEFRGEVNSFFTEKTKISEWYNNAKAFILSKFNKSNETDNAAQQNNASQQNENKENNVNEQKANKEQSNGNEVNDASKPDEKKSDENIGGAIENSEKEKEKNSEKIEDSKKELSEAEKMKKTADEIKSKISFILPIKGRISSTFGWRNPTTATVPKYHTGLDIAANEGTVIKSATDGKVIMASSKGDYGNHYQIQIQDVILVYAHCKKLYLKEGDTVKQGQEIAEVGSTGNSTGPHLHFEIRKGNEKIDPQLVLNF